MKTGITLRNPSSDLEMRLYEDGSLMIIKGNIEIGELCVLDVSEAPNKYYIKREPLEKEMD